MSWHDLALDALRRLGAGPAAPLTGIVEDALHYGSGAAPRGVPAQPAPEAAQDDPRLRQPLSEAAPAPAAPSALSPDASGNAADEAAARRGKGIHLLLQLLDENQASAAAAMRSRLQGKLQGAVTDAEFRGWLTMAQAVKEAPGLKRFFDPAQYRQAWNEVSVPHGDDGRSGEIDRLVDDGAALWILDYKTTPHTDAAALDQRHRTQLQAYAASVRRIWPGRPLRAGLVLTESREWLELLRSED